MDIDKKQILDPSFKDKNNNSFQVMMDWEKPYMEKCIQTLNPFGDVLEIGFGMGYSATAINKYPIRSYTVIEKDKDVIKKFNKWKLKQKTKKINLIEGLWQIKIPLINKKFDCIFFDDSPAPEINVRSPRHTLFVKLILLKIVKHNTRLVSYSTSATPCNISWSSSDTYNKHINNSVICTSNKFKIKIPYFCRYAKGNYMYVNKIVFKK
jgi:hypothetical protein|tara:strand:+ start:107 stop:733 length:627 start_codon:yes stop_codon:yes gene_type:complete